MDEAERCHALAILENGIKRADGTPKSLMENMKVTVIEVSGDDLRTLKNHLVAQPEVLSTAQLGTRLRVLIHDWVTDPELWLTQQIDGRSIERVRPSLEDVFVASTGGHRVG